MHRIKKNLGDGFGYEFSVIRKHLKEIRGVDCPEFDNCMVKYLILKSFGASVQLSKHDNHKKSQVVFMVGAKTSPHKLVKKLRSLSDPIITSTKEL